MKTEKSSYRNIHVCISDSAGINVSDNVSHKCHKCLTWPSLLSPLIKVTPCWSFSNICNWLLCYSGGLWNVFTLGGVGSRPGVEQDLNPLPLSNQSLQLLLVLANLTDGPDCPNPYRQAITCFKNTQGEPERPQFVCDFISINWINFTESATVCVSDSSSIPSPQPHTFQINFNSLYTALCEQQKSDQVTLLLYTLLHQNSNMRTYILSRTDMENLVRSRAFSTCAHAFHSANRTHAFIQMQLQTPDCCQSFIVGRTS